MFDNFMMEDAIDIFYEGTAKKGMSPAEFKSSINAIKSVDTERVNNLKSIYGARPSKELAKIITFANKATFIDANGTSTCRILSYKEMCDGPKDLGDVLVKMKAIPVMDLGENDFVCSNGSGYCTINTNDNVKFNKKSSIFAYFKAGKNKTTNESAVDLFYETTMEHPSTIDLEICGQKFNNVTVHYAYYNEGDTDVDDDELTYMFKNMQDILKNKKKYESTISRAIKTRAEDWLREEADFCNEEFPDKVDDIMKYLKPKYLYICGKSGMKYHNATSALMMSHNIGDREMSICMKNMSFIGIHIESYLL